MKNNFLTTFLFGLLVVMGGLLMLRSPPLAQVLFPARPVTIWVGFPAGGTTDIIIRALAECAEKSLGQRIVIVNKPGGSGAVCASLLIKERPDGYTLGGFTDTPVTRSPHLTDLNFDPLGDLSFVIRAGTWNCIFAAKADSPFKKWEDVIDWAKKNPGQLIHGHTGTGSSHHLAMVRVALKEGFTFRSVPFAGDAPLISALLGGHVMVASMGTVAVRSHIEAKSISALLAFEREGLDYAPNTPTFEKMNYDFGIIPPFLIIAAPKGTPDVIKETLEKAFSDGMKTERFMKIAKDQDLILTEPLTGKPLLDYLRKCNRSYEQFIREAGIYKIERKK